MERCNVNNGHDVPRYRDKRILLFRFSVFL
jgi:hypothetical protein